ncbi:MAG: hypothetical protein ACKV0T_14750 [Planctomycetales bacterium]
MPHPLPSSGSSAAHPPRRSGGWRPRLPRRRARRALFLAVYALFCVGLVSGTVRWFWRVRGNPDNPWEFYYPELRRTGLTKAVLTRHDDTFDVLLLGGSVLEPAWGDIEHRLRQRLSGVAPDRFRLFNLACVAHTSRDSYLKYSHLEEKSLDLVIVYDGINDVRMNNVPPELFRDDYSHCGWYRSVEKCLELGRVSLPAAVRQQFQTLGETIGLGGPRTDEQADYGKEIKTPVAFRKNLLGILRLAEARGDAVLFNTYASHIPDDYSRERFDAMELDYSYRPDGRSCGVEMWGRPENVRATLAAHNEELRRLVVEHPTVRLVDQARLIEGSGAHFVDPCHLTRKGCEAFVDNLWPQVLQRWQEWQASESESVADEPGNRR